MPWSWAAASRVGTSHLRTGTRCQDAHRCFERHGRLVAIVSDGAGSAAEGARGAAIICRSVATWISARLDLPDLPDDVALQEMVDEVRDRIAHVAAHRGQTSRDFAATLVAVVAGEEQTLAVHVGDGGAVLADADGWQAASWPEAGEFAGTTYFVTDDAGARVRISRHAGRADRLAVFTDGIERLALDFASGRPHAPFFDGITRPLSAGGGPGRLAAVSDRLGAFLDGDAVNSRTDDDKTLIIARRT